MRSLRIRSASIARVILLCHIVKTDEALLLELSRQADTILIQYLTIHFKPIQSQRNKSPNIEQFGSYLPLLL